MKEIKTLIDHSFFKGNPQIAAKRRYLEPDEGGQGLINIKDFGDALRLAWAKRETDEIS